MSNINILSSLTNIFYFFLYPLIVIMHDSPPNVAN